MKPKNPRKPYKVQGFTLVELIVVITILVILGTISFLQLGGFAGSARDSRRVSDMANITQAIELAVVTQGNAPIPTNPVSYTGGSVIIQAGTVTNTTVPKMSGDFSDPITKLPYNYSVFGNGLYYQLGIDFENPLSYHTNSVGVDMASSIGIPGIDTVYADNGVKYSKLSGSYKFDPSLPSLFVLPGTVNSASGGIFSPDVCFILNNVSTNTFSSTSTGCVAKKNMALKTLDSSLVGYWDMETLTGGLLKDLSGNGNDFTGTINLTGSVMGKGLLNPMGVNTLLSYNTGSNITFGFFLNLTSYNQGCSFLSNYNGKGYIFRTTPPGEGGNIFEFLNIANTDTRVRTDANFSIGTYYIVGKYDNGIQYMYINGKLIGKNDSINIPYNKNNSVLSMNFGGCTGIIDDVKIYNRALSDDEIKQHAKIAGF